MNTKRFPNLYGSVEDKNPGISLFGRRFYSDQTDIEFLVEFLLVFISKKRVGGKTGRGISFLDKDLLRELASGNIPLEYLPPSRIILKLFTFLGSSKLETRHPSHKDRFVKLINELEETIETTGNIGKKNIIEIVEQVLLGFVGVAQNRTWCTQTFLPVASNLLSVETRWKEVQANKRNDLKWDEAIKENYFTFSSHLFMARGGELLFLQLCNLFEKSGDNRISDFRKILGYDSEPLEFKQRLENGLSELLSSVSSVNTLSQWVEKNNSETEQNTNNITISCGWCPSETWPEAYLFAYEMANICDSIIDPLKKIEMLKLCCVLQVIRSICAQSVRWNAGIDEKEKKQGGINGYSWIVVDPETQNKSLKDVAKANLVRIQNLIHGALRTKPPLQSEINRGQSGYKRSDEKHGQGLILRIGKAIGFIAPVKGPGPRFVMNESLLRYFVLALIPPGNRMTLETFKEKLYLHFGIAVGGEQLDKAMQWTYPLQDLKIRKKDDDWFEEKLRATGFLIPLSDAVSLVINPFSS